MLKELSKFIEPELIEFNKGYKKSLSTSVKEYESILDYIFKSQGKQIRPILGILISKMLGEFSEKQNKFLQAIELIHNATLFHDDIIDEADTRRNLPTLNKIFSNKAAVLSGDYFITCAIKNICQLENPTIMSLFSEYMKEICEGEIAQNLSLNKIPAMDEYLEKTRRKTALLFTLTAQGTAILSKETENSSKLAVFGEKAGMIYQLKDDMKNFDEYEDKPVLNDLSAGIVTAPVIFLSQENKDIKKLVSQKEYDKILTLLKKSTAIDKTKNLIHKYIIEAETVLNHFPENKYKAILLKLLAEFGK